MDIKNVALVGGAFLIYLNGMATYQLLKSKIYTISQTTYQIIFIWLVPILGAFSVLYFIGESRSQSDKPSSLYDHIHYWVTFEYLFKDGSMSDGVSSGVGDYADGSDGCDGGDGD